MQIRKTYFSQTPENVGENNGRKAAACGGTDSKMRNGGVSREAY